MVRLVKVEDAVGEKQAHDVVQYGPELKSVQFKRGHVVRPEDIEKLKNSGDYFVHVEDGGVEGVHEDEAALRMARASMGENTHSAPPNSGKVTILAKTPGILKVDADVIRNVNMQDGFIISTIPGGSAVRKNQVIASVKIVPLSVEKERMEDVERILAKPVLDVKPVGIKSVGVIVTGTEVYEGRVKDAFLPVLQKKLGDYGLGINESTFIYDDEGEISRRILEFKNRGHEIILVCGGMAVDAGDVTASAIRRSGAEVISRGVPVFPGSMLMLAYLGDVPLVGLPACVIPDERTAFDLILPKLLAKEKILKEDLARMGNAGLLG